MPDLRLVKKVPAHRFLHVLAQGFPCVALRENVFRKALGAVTVLFLRHLKHQFVHFLELCAIPQVRATFLSPDSPSQAIPGIPSPSRENILSP